MSTFTVRRAEYQAKRQGRSLSSNATGSEGDTDTVPWSTADDRALEDAVVLAWMGPLFVGAKT